MKYIVGMALAWMIGFSAGAKAETPPSSTASAEEAAVIQAEDDWIRAEINNDEATLRRVLDDQFVVNSNDGTTTGKEDLIKSALAWNMTGQTITERTVIVDGDTAVIFGTTELRFGSPDDSEDIVSLLRYTTVYKKRGDQWRAIALHMARRATDE